MITIDNRSTFVTVFAKPKTQTKTFQLSCLKQWEKAINTEYNNLICNSVIEWVDKLPINKHVITRKVVYKEKEKENRCFLKCCIYIVVRGFSQISSEDFIEIFTLVAKFAILCVYLTLVAYFDQNLEQIDIVTAFLNEELKEGIYMRVSKEFQRFRNGKLYQ